VDALDGLRAACPELAIDTGERAREAAATDALRPSRGGRDLVRPLAVLAPATTAHVAALVRWAGEAGVAVVVRGGGSGLMGGAATAARAVVVDMQRMGAVAVDADACQVRAGTGATLARVDDALAPHGLMLGHDPWTVAVATVGGVLSTNGLGYLGARAGSVRAQVRAVEVVLADGRVLRTRAAPARSTGLEPTQLFVGTEGTLGIVTEATLAVLPRPEERLVRGYDLPSFAAGVEVAVALRRSGIRFACLELSADELPPAPASLLLVCDGLAGEATLHAGRAAAVIERAGGTARTQADADAQWNGRHAIAERWAASRRTQRDDLLPDARGHAFDYAHVAVPVAALPALRARAHGLVRAHDLTLIEEGLWHWPELYSIVVAGPPGSAAGVRATIDGVCRDAQAAGGTMEYCHGVGTKLAHLMEAEHGAAGLDLLRTVKRALDPRGVLNPGKEDV
jgi:FAD/FMN-containing dehydrogenase